MAVEMDGQHGAHGAAGRAVDHDASAHVAFLGEEVFDLGRVQPHVEASTSTKTGTAPQ